jgi:hypothetical protein
MLTASSTSRAGARAPARGPIAAAAVAPRRLARAATVGVRADAAVADKAATSGVEKSGPGFKAVLDIEAIKGILPHR